MRYRVVLNATTLKRGGGIQACVSFVRTSLKAESDIQWVYFVSSRVNEELSKFGVEIDPRMLKVFEVSPAQNRRVRGELAATVKSVKPDGVFTFFGPAYVDFQVPHLCGVADGWVTHSTRIAYGSLRSNLDKLLTLLRCTYKGWWYRRADQWVVEAECARKGLKRRLAIDESHVHLVPNSCAAHYFENAVGKCPLGKAKNKTILTLSSYHPHKNLELIPRVAHELKNVIGHDDFRFVITIPKQLKESKLIEKAARQLNVANNVVNIGPVSVKDGPKLYAAVDVVFVPTLLETFSSVYPEAMACNKPIVTTDLEFAHDICGDAALFFAPLDPMSAATNIAEILRDQCLEDFVVAEGAKVLETLPTAERKYRMHESIMIDTIVNYWAGADSHKDRCRGT